MFIGSYDLQTLQATGQNNTRDGNELMTENGYHSRGDKMIETAKLPHTLLTGTLR